MICCNLRCVFHQGDWYRVLGRKRCSAMFIFISFRSASTNPLPSWFKKAECGFGIAPAGSRCVAYVCVHLNVPRKSYWIHLVDVRWDLTVLQSPLTADLSTAVTVIRTPRYCFTSQSATSSFWFASVSHRTVSICKPAGVGVLHVTRHLTFNLICLQLRLSVFRRASEKLVIKGVSQNGKMNWRKVFSVKGKQASGTLMIVGNREVVELIQDKLQFPCLPLWRAVSTVWLCNAFLMVQGETVLADGAK